MLRSYSAFGRLVLSLALLWPTASAGYIGLEVASHVAQKDARITIDGRTEPSRIPAWQVWESAFRQVGQGSTELLDAIQFDIGFSEEDFAVIREESKRHGRREEQCLKAQLALGADERSQGLASSGVRAVTLTCREATLAAADRMFAAVSSEGQEALHRWADTLRAGLQVHLLRSEEAFYKQPR